MTDCILDCSSPSTACRSTARLLGLAETELRARLRRLEVPPFEEPRSFIAERVAGVTCDDLPIPEAIHWFHGTRVLDPESFRRHGILPKSAMRSRLMQTLSELAAGIERSGQYPNCSSVLGKRWVCDEGPFAFFVRTVAVDAPGSTHAYTSAPESVEDIAGELVGANYHLVVERFQELSVPCVVTFRAAGASYHVAHALQYLYWREHGCEDAEAGDIANTCFDAGGAAIPPSAIVAVERVARGNGT